jgi:hypothetical protein
LRDVGGFEGSDYSPLLRWPCEEEVLKDGRQKADDRIRTRRAARQRQR